MFKLKQLEKLQEMDEGVLRELIRNNLIITRKERDTIIRLQIEDNDMESDLERYDKGISTIKAIETITFSINNAIANKYSDEELKEYVLDIFEEE